MTLWEDWTFPTTPVRSGERGCTPGERCGAWGHVGDTCRRDMFFNNTTSEDNFTSTDYPEFTNNTTTAATTTTTTAAPRWALVGLSIIPVWILFGNMLVLLAVIWNRNLQTLSNCVIASLAVTDFMLALLVVPLGTYQVVSNNVHYFIMCLIISHLHIKRESGLP